MWAENNSDGIGATFSFTLPLVIQHEHKESIVTDTLSARTVIVKIEKRKEMSLIKQK